MVLESADEVLDRVIEFRRAVNVRMCQCPTVLRQEEEEQQAASGQL
jgi:hypothetical protein